MNAVTQYLLSSPSCLDPQIVHLHSNTQVGEGCPVMAQWPELSTGR